VKKYYVVQPIRDTPVSVYDGGGQHVSTRPEVDSGTPKKYYVIHVDKLKLCTAATQSQDSVATLPTTHYLVVMAVGDPIARGADTDGNRRT